MAKWLVVKNGKVVGAYAPREATWKKHYQAMVKAGKYQAFVEAEDSEPASEGWLYQDGQFLSPLPAGGYVTVTDGSKLEDGDILNISDGCVLKVFEFDSNSETMGGNVPIAFGAENTVTQVQESVLSAINGAEFGVLATLGSEPGVVTLTNKSNGQMGNVAITTTVGSSEFVVSGMSGGRG